MASEALINTLIAEAGGEGYEGLVAAAWAIAQRAAARGQTMDQVIKSGFDGYSNPGSGAVQAQKSQALRNQVAQIVSGVQSGSIPNPVPGADHFLSGTATPSWSKGMKLVATIGGHRFYASGDVPASAQGAAPPKVAPIPQIRSANLGNQPQQVTPTELPARPSATPSLVPQMPPPLPRPRPATAPANLIEQTFSRLPQQQNLGDGLGMNPIQGGTQQAPMFDAMYDERLGAMTMSDPVNSQGIYTTRSSAPPPIPAMMSPQMAASRNPVTPTPAQMSPQLAARRATDPVLQAALNARYPTRLPEIPPSTIGQPPTTRVVQSVPAPPRFALTQSPTVPAPSGVTRTDGIAGQVALPPGVRPQVPSLSTPITPNYNSMTSAQRAAIAAMPIPDRLTANPGLPENYGNSGVAGVGTRALAPIPMDRPPNFTPPPQVGTQLSTTPVPPLPIPSGRIAPIPFAKPNFGMGGPDILPTNPTPMPRLQRKGLSIGPFQVGGPIGAITRAMANSSGPFNNGGDNLLYNIMRGGDFNTPGAATHQSTSGYLFAPKQGGGFTNVGRANPQMSPAMTYAMANARDSRGNTPGGFASEGRSDWFNAVTGN